MTLTNVTDGKQLGITIKTGVEAAADIIERNLLAIGVFQRAEHLIVVRRTP